MKLSLTTYPVRFRMRFAHGSASRDATENVICAAETDAHTGYGEGCPRSYVTGESLSSAGTFFAEHQAELSQTAVDLAGLRGWIADNRPAIALNPAAFAAMELALIDLLSRQAGQGVEAFLGLPAPSPVAISGVFGVTGAIGTAAMAAGYRLFAMSDAKVKISDDAPADRARLRRIHRMLGPNARLRVDANNLFASPDQCIAHMAAIDAPVWAIEEPIAARDYNGMDRIAEATGARIILDESATRPEDLAQVEGPRWIVNLRVSKMGGLIRSLQMLELARQRGLGVIIGCHVGETSLLTRAALALACAGGTTVEAVECAYGGYLLARDLTRPGIRFGRRGVVRPTGGPGFGLDVRRELLVPLR